MPAATQVQHVHMVHIRTTPEKLWQALTRPELTCQYYYDTVVRSTFEPAANIEYLRQNKDGTTKTVVTGQVLVSPRTFARVEASVTAQPVGELRLKGFNRPIVAHNVTGLVAPLPA